MKEYLLHRLSVTDTRKSTDVLNREAENGWIPVHFFRTVQGDLGVVYEREKVVEKKAKKSIVETSTSLEEILEELEKN